MRRRAKVDANHRAIVAALKAAGCSVLELQAVGGGCPDLLVGRAGWDRLVEIKRPGVGGKARGVKQAATNAKQAEFADSWRGAAVVRAETIEQALAAVGVFLARP